MSVLERVKQEQSELGEKIEKLSAFLDKTVDDVLLREKIGREQMNLLRQQEVVMRQYFIILQYRIMDMKKNEPKEK